MPAPYPTEFRREAVALLMSSGKTLPQLASELGVSPQSLTSCGRASATATRARSGVDAGVPAPQVLHGTGRRAISFLRVGGRSKAVSLVSAS